ncbi:MAG: glycerate kinase [Acidobacteria bacterium]|nr:glycerate kinase [Acidobacteriota bacterium]
MSNQTQPGETLAQLRRDAIAIFEAGVQAADPHRAVLAALAGERADRVWVVGAGKATAAMARAAEDHFGSAIQGGVINIKDGHSEPLQRVEQVEASHPLPDERGVAGARRIAALASQAQAGDLVLCLISGGASALMPLPAEGITLAEKQATTRLLLGCGANIHELNCVRKHLSAIKGGQLAQLAAPARVLALILSDVVGDNLDVIGSGPTVPDSSTAAEAVAILQRYGLLQQVPAAVRARLESGAETPKPGDPAFAQVRNRIVGSNRLAAEAAMARAAELGYLPRLLSTTLEGEARDVGRHLAQERGCVIAGGETTVTLTGTGKGGRNQEMALAAAIALDGEPDTVFLSAGTDGTDGPTDAAGAIADGTTLAVAREKGLAAGEFLTNSDSYHFFQAVGGLIITGPTGTNVMDLQIRLTR